jgi:hypothetical protein
MVARTLASRTVPDMNNTAHRTNPRRSNHTSSATRKTEETGRTSRPAIDPSHVIRSHCGRHPDQGDLTIKELHEFDLGWIAEMVHSDGSDATVRYIVTRNGKISAMAGWVSVDTNIYQFMKRPGAMRDAGL